MGSKFGRRDPLRCLDLKYNPTHTPSFIKLLSAFRICLWGSKDPVFSASLIAIFKADYLAFNFVAEAKRAAHAKTGRPSGLPSLS